MSNVLRESAAQQFAEELENLISQDTGHKPTGWQMSPQSVVTYLMGGKLKNKFEITPKYIGNQRLMEIAVATLTTDRALLLYGIPGTGKSWVSEHITSAITGDPSLLIQGTAGTGEEAIRYGWNYAKLLAEGELDMEVQAQKGFNIIATANNRDKGVNELSSAMKRRFNTVILPVPATAQEEVNIVETRVKSQMKALELPAEPPHLDEIKRVVQIFRELRNGQTEDGRTKVKSPTGTVSTAEVISVVNSGLSLAAHFGNGKMTAHDMASGLIGAVVKDPVQDSVVWKEYLETVVKPRESWKDIYRACREIGF